MKKLHHSKGNISASEYEPVVQSWLNEFPDGKYDHVAWLKAYHVWRPQYYHGTTDVSWGIRKEVEIEGDSKEDAPSNEICEIVTNEDTNENSKTKLSKNQKKKQKQRQKEKEKANWNAGDDTSKK